MDEAVEQVRLHYRAVHPTKGFRAPEFTVRCENWNKSAEDWLDECRRSDGNISWTYVNEILQGYNGDVATLMPAAIAAELQGLWAAAQAPVQAVAVDGDGAGVNIVQWDNDAAGPAAADIPFPAPPGRRRRIQGLRPPQAGRLRY